MIVVDSSVWIDYINDKDTPAVAALDALFPKEAIAIPDLALAEVLQGARSERDFQTMLRLFDEIETISTVDEVVAVEAARNYRHLRTLGITVRKTIDTLIATRCIIDGYDLLHSDRDFDLFVAYLGLRVVAA